MNAWAWKCFTGVIVSALLFLLRTENTHWRNQETYCRYWLKLNPWNLTPFYGLGKIHMNRDEYAKAVYYFQGGINRLGYNTVFILADLGYCYHVLGQEQNAYKFLNAAIDEDSSYSLTYHYLGILFLDHRMGRQAFVAFEQASRLYPRLFRSQDNMMKSKDVKGFSERILKVYEQLARMI